MSERDNELFEAELKRLKPAPLPADLLGRIEQRVSAAAPRETEANQAPEPRVAGWWLWLRWLAPATAVVLAALVVMSQGGKHRITTPPAPAAATAASEPILKADEVEVDQELLGSFEAVADLPDGEPVRFRCRQWIDEVTFRDSARGVEVVQRVPRMEVVPVSFASY
jgi:hypothetical protein